MGDNGIEVYTAASLKAEANERLHALNEKFDEMCLKFENTIKMRIYLLTSNNQMKSIAEEIADAEKTKSDLSENTSGTSTLSRKRSISCIMEDEGYITEESRNKKHASCKTPYSYNQTKSNLSNKTIINGSMSKLSTAEKMSRYRSKAPGRGISAVNNQTYGMITPKVCPNKTVTILRRPQQGEIAISLAGSPLLVSNIANDEMANVNIPLQNGKTLSLLPTHMGNMDLSAIPKFDPDTKKQLRMLAEHLQKIAGAAK